MKVDRIWRVRSAAGDTADRIRRELGVKTVTARVLASRGARTPAEARLLLDAGSGGLHSPWLLPQMEQAVRRLAWSRRQGERVVVYGDYDADGQTATALMVIGLRRLGIDVRYYIPHRVDEGYGLNTHAVQMLADTGATLLVTVDCGSTAAAEVAQAARLGMDCIVTDHHDIAGALAPARALVNPKIAGSNYPWPYLAGVGVAFKLMSALGEHLRCSDLVHDLIDLVALGTIADVVPLRDENRVLAYLGLEKMNRAPVPGLAALAATSQLQPGAIDAYGVAFQMAPRLNAGGRLADAAGGLEMLLAPSMQEALPVAGELDRANQARKALEEEILEQARQKAAGQGDTPVLVVDGEQWHPGVIGIVASRLVDLYGRPAVVVATEGAWGTGSGRSVPGFHLTRALEANSHLLERFGGHAMAAGLTVPVEHLAALRRGLAAEARQQLGGEGRVTPELYVDAWVDPAELDMALLKELEQLGPFGYGNAAPVLAWYGAEPRQVRTMGSLRNHLRLTLPVGRSQITAVGFRLGELASQISGPHDLAFTLSVNEWQGRQELQLRLRDLRPTPLPGAWHEAGGGGGLGDIAGTGLFAGQPTLEAQGTLYYDGRPFHGQRDSYIDAVARRFCSPVVWVLQEAQARELSRRTSGCRAVVAWPGGPLPQQAGAPWALVLCGPPVGECFEQVWSRLAGPEGPAEVHVLYTQAEEAAGRACIEADWPDRDGLVQAFLEIRRLAVAGRAFTAEALAKATALSHAGARRAIAVFHELGLLQGLAGQWILLPDPGRKLDLNSAVSYNESIAKRQKALQLLTDQPGPGAFSRWFARPEAS